MRTASWLTTSQKFLRFKATIEPKLRRGATDEIDTDMPLDEVVAKIREIAGS